jgi:ABC-2 type transport system permease protein
VTAVFAAVPVLLAGLIAVGPHRLAFGCFAGAVLGSLLYSAVFVMISAALRHPVAYALAYVALWESLLTRLVGGAKWLSVEQWSLGLAHAISNNGDLSSTLSLTPSLVMPALVLVAVTAYGTRRLSAFTLHAD